MVAFAAVDDRVQLVFSWDPRVQSWLKERGPEDAARPPAAPLDDGAVQTYFLDAQTGRWVSTILGPRGRLIADAIGKYYRMPAVAGLAIAQEVAEEPRFNVEGVRHAYRWFREQGFIPEPVSEAAISDLLGVELVDEVLAEIGRVPD